MKTPTWVTSGCLDAEWTLFDVQLDRVRLPANLHASIIGVYKASWDGGVGVAEGASDEAETACRAADAG